MPFTLFWSAHLTSRQKLYKNLDVGIIFLQNASTASRKCVWQLQKWCYSVIYVPFITCRDLQHEQSEHLATMHKPSPPLGTFCIASEKQIMYYLCPMRFWCSSGAAACITTIIIQPHVLVVLALLLCRDM